MKKIVFAILCMMPFTTMAQDNTWERIEIEETDETKVNPDLKYLEGAVPMVNGKVEFSTVIKAPGKNKEQIYDITKKYLTKMTTEPNQTEFSRVVIDNPEKGELCGPSKSGSYSKVRRYRSTEPVFSSISWLNAKTAN